MDIIGGGDTETGAYSNYEVDQVEYLKTCHFDSSDFTGEGNELVKYTYDSALCVNREYNKWSYLKVKVRQKMIDNMTRDGLFAQAQLTSTSKLPNPVSYCEKHNAMRTAANFTTLE